MDRTAYVANRSENLRPMSSKVRGQEEQYRFWTETRFHQENAKEVCIIEERE